MKLTFEWLLLVSIVAAAPVAAQPNVSRGELVFSAEFEGKDALRQWANVAAAQVTLTPGRSAGQSVSVALATNASPTAWMIRTPLPLERLRGARLKFHAMVKAEAIAHPPNPWNGVKFMLHVVSPAGQRWEQQNGVFGTFDWKPVEFTATVPRDATRAELLLGLEATTGRAWFDDVRVTVAMPPRLRLARTNSAPAYKGHDLPRLRGAMIGPQVGASDLQTLGRDWGANHVRWQLIWGGFPRSPADKGDLAAYDRWLESELQRLDGLLPVCRAAGILVLIDLHTPPGGRNDRSECGLFHERRFQDKFVELWEKIARRYKGNQSVWGYDLVNEPVEGTVGDGLMDWQELATQTAQRVRALDPDHAIIIEPAPWGSPDSLENLEPLALPGVVYSVHIYVPHKFTHQGVYDNAMGLAYPGMVDGKYWNKEQLRRALRPVIEFQRDYGVHLYIGEFSAIRWAPDDSARRYLSDVIDLLEEYGWDWAYHAFREWDGWSVEHGPDRKDRKPSQTQTSREKLLRSWFARNVKPAQAAR